MAPRDKTDPARGDRIGSLALLAALASDSCDAIIGSDPDGRILVWNAAAESLLGYPAEKMLGKKAGRIFSSADVPNDASGDVLELERGVAWRGETSALCADGSRVRVTVVALPVLDDSGAITASAMILRRAGEGSPLEEDARRSQASLHGVINAILDPVFVKDEQHRWVFLNDAFCRFLGHPREELIGKSDPDYFSAKEAEVFWDKDRHVFETGEENVSDEEFTDSSGVTHAINTRKSLFVGARGEKFIVGCIRDLTGRRQIEVELRRAHDGLERKVEARTAELSEANRALSAQVWQTRRALEALQESEQRYRRVVDHIIDALLVNDQTGHLVYANDRFLELFGVGREDLAGFQLENYTAPEWRDGLKEHFNRRLHGMDAPLEFSYEGMRKDGSRLWLQTIVTAIANDGVVVGTQTIIRDITEKRRAERLQSALYRIVELARSPEDLQKVYASIHGIVGELIYAKNLYIALYDSATDMIHFPYYVDEKDPPSPPRKFGRGLTEYVIHTGEPLIATPDKLDELVRQGELKRRGSASLDWMGVPLKKGDETIGALVLQSYEPIVQYGEAEKEILLIVSQQIAAAILAKRSDAALQESEKKFRAVAETSPTLILVSDGYHLNYANPATETVSGYSREELLSGDPWMLLREDYRVLMQERAQVRLRGESAPRKYEFPIVTKSGEERWLGVLATTIEFGGKAAILASAEDITERRRAEQLQSALYRISEQAAAAVDLPQFFASLHSIVGGLMPANNFYIALYDKATDTLSFPYFVDEEDVTPTRKKLGKGLTEYVLHTGEPLLASPEVFDEMVEGGQVEKIGASSVDWLGVPLKSGSTTFGALVVQSYTENVRFNEKHQSILTFVSQNIATAIERKSSAEALRQSEVRYRRQVENAVYGIYRSGVEDRFLEVNPALVSMLGYASTEEVLALRLSQDVYANPDELAELMEEYRHQDQIKNIQVLWKRKGGDPFTVRLSGRVVRNEQGAVESLEMIAEDITERWTLEQQLRQAQKMEAVGRLAGGVAHDFNNLLMVIQSYTEMLEDGLPPNDPLQANTREIIKAAERAAGLTGRMLAFSRKQLTSPVLLDLNSVVQEASKMLERLIGEDIEVRVHPATPLWAIEADPDQIVQILMNLCVNARDAMPKGGTLTIRTGNLSVGSGNMGGHYFIPPGDYVQFSVADTGMGIPKELHEQVFEPFYTTKGVGKGTGLGLSTVYGIVKQSGGYVWVKSEPEHGAEFTVVLPALTHLAQTVVSPSTESRPRGTETLLVVEDEDALRNAMGAYLRSLGYTVLLANSGPNALAIADQQPHIDLLITDMVMPKMNGAELSQALLKLRPDLKVIHMSGYTGDTILEQDQRERSDHFLQKPFSLSVLARRLRDALDAPKTKATSN